MKEKSVSVAELIKTQRKKYKMSQRKLSAILGYHKVHAQYISNVERGLCQFPKHKINELSSAIGITRELIVEALVTDYRASLESKVYNKEPSNYVISS